MIDNYQFTLVVNYMQRESVVDTDGPPPRPKKGLHLQQGLIIIVT